MPSITIARLAKGLQDVMSNAEFNRVKKALVDEGRSVACRTMCSIIESKTGLPRSLCKPVCNTILTKTAKDIRKKL